MNACVMSLVPASHAAANLLGPIIGSLPPASQQAIAEYLAWGAGRLARKGVKRGAEWAQGKITNWARSQRSRALTVSGKSGRGGAVRSSSRRPIYRAARRRLGKFRRSTGIALFKKRGRWRRRYRRYRRR